MNILENVKRIFKKDSDTLKGGKSIHNYRKAPKSINCENISYFNVESYLLSLSQPVKYSYVYCYACSVKNGVILELKYRDITTLRGDTETVTILQLVDKDVMKLIDKIVKKYEFVNNNGYSNYVYGLPTDFGGHVDVRYTNGDFIYKSDNQTSLIPSQSAVELVDSLIQYIETHTISRSYSNEIQSIDFISQNDNNRYHKYHIENNLLSVERKYQKGIDEIKKQIEINPETVNKIINIIDDNLFLECQLMPINEKLTSDKMLVVKLKNGERKTVNGNMMLPSGGLSSLHEIERELFLVERQ